MKELMSTREAAQFLDVNEKMIYTLISDKKLPATKITGKWLFPKHLVEQWIEANTINYPEPTPQLPPYHGLLIIAGSNDPLLEAFISHFNSRNPEHLAVFGNIGSMGGLMALKQNRCHIATSHLMQDNEKEYNFDFAGKTFEQMPAVVNFCLREQGILVQKGNPKKIEGVADLARPDVTMINRPLGTGTRLLIDNEFKKIGIDTDTVKGYQNISHRHMDVGLEILSGRIDAGPAIRPVASILNLDFIPLRWERYDLLIAKDRFFDQGVQLFIGLLHEKDLANLSLKYNGYDTKLSGKMVYPQA
ncbi:MAG: helix-turn-helix transcriptional regulator [Desulfobacterales bacterium]|jgi:excisionase family DNA binding protein|nr:helix-turn-helix transcriptional regulator [Desulfobacterales bacterium]